MKKSACVIVTSILWLALGLNGLVSADALWTGEGGDNRWDNPANWLDELLPTEVDTALIRGPEAEGANGPLIEDGIEAVAGILVSDAGVSNMTMTGGHLELAGWGAWWSDAAGTTATFNMSGGVIDFVGSPGILEMGWQELSDPVGSSVGIWEITGGEINARGVDIPGKNQGGVGIINLHGGIINVGTERGGLMLYEGAHIDITYGVMKLEGDQTAQVEDYIGNGYITAYDGNGEVVMVYDDEYTTVTGKLTGVPGDFNGDGTLDATDIDDLTTQSAAVTNPPAYDLNADNLVNETDVNVWVKDLFNSWIGDADLNGEFNSGDLVSVLAAGTYEADVDAVWSTGDFNGDGRTNSTDLVAALADGGYEQGPRAAVAAAVPEPTAIVLALLGAVLSGKVGRRRS